MTSLVEITLETHKALLGAKIPHAIGGALALGYYAEPRSTIDLDINIFLTEEDLKRVFEVLEKTGCQIDRKEALRSASERGDFRAYRDEHRIDIFISFHPYHGQVKKRVRKVPFKDAEIPILSPEDIIIFKVLFDRPKDRLDLENLAAAQVGLLDINYLRHWARELLPPEDSRLHRLETQFC